MGIGHVSRLILDLPKQSFGNFTMVICYKLCYLCIAKWTQSREII